MEKLQIAGRGFVWFTCVTIALVSWGLNIGGVQEIVANHVETRAIALYAHIIFGPIAMILMPFQFWAGLRRRHPDIHRWVGRFSIIAILIAATGGLIIAPFVEAGPLAASGFLLLAVLWIGTTLNAYRHIRAGRVALHREWMIRVAAMTFAAVTLRLWIPFYFLATDLEFSVFYPIIAWQCWVLNLVAVEIYLRVRGKRSIRLETR